MNNCAHSCTHQVCPRSVIFTGWRSLGRWAFIPKAHHSVNDGASGSLPPLGFSWFQRRMPSLLTFIVVAVAIGVVTFSKKLPVFFIAQRRAAEKAEEEILLKTVVLTIKAALGVALGATVKRVDTLPGFLGWPASLRQLDRLGFISRDPNPEGQQRGPKQAKRVERKPGWLRRGRTRSLPQGDPKAGEGGISWMGGSLPLGGGASPR